MKKKNKNKVVAPSPAPMQRQRVMGMPVGRPATMPIQLQPIVQPIAVVPYNTVDQPLIQYSRGNRDDEYDEY